MDIDYLHISAFTSTPGLGNAAGVCELDEWPDDPTLSRLAQQISLPVTSCIVRRDGKLELRWLSRAGTPVRSMCGHGTLAASFAVSLHAPLVREFSFQTPGGPVPVRRQGDLFYLRLPRWNAKTIASWPELVDALGGEPVEMLDGGRDVISVFADEDEIRRLSPDMGKLRELGHRGFIATAPGAEFDCVSRFFCPSFGLGVDEDPVTGSAHCAIAPFWSERLGKRRLNAYQASSTGGQLTCEVLDDGVVIGASAALEARRTVSLA